MDEKKDGNFIEENEKEKDLCGYHLSSIHFDHDANDGFRCFGKQFIYLGR